MQRKRFSHHRLVLSFRVHSLYFSLESIEDLSRLLEGTLRQERESFAAWVTKEAEQLPPEQRQDFYDLHIDDAIELEEVFPSFARGSLFITAFALFEALVSSWCSTVASVRAMERPALLSLDRKISFLERECGIHFEKAAPEWNDMKMAQKVRHLLVHSEGRVPRHKRDLKPSLRARIPLDFADSDRIVLSDRAVPWLRSLLEKLAASMWAEVESSLEPDLTLQ